MQRSTPDRILTTATGSLPRPQDLAELLIAQQQGQSIDEPAFETRLSEAVAEAVAKQAEAGLHVVSDGEMSKVDYMDYVGDRLTGFGPDIPPGSFWMDDLVDVPEIVMAVYGGTSLRFRECVADVAYVRPELVQRDIANFKAALDGVDVAEAFMPAISPGVVAMMFPNRHYPSYEAYVLALGEALRPEYQAIVDAGLLLQIDAPDLAAAAHMHTWMAADRDRLGMRGLQRVNVEAINNALAGIDPERVRLHLCWANYQGPHTHDLPLADALVPAFEANVAGISFEGANAAHAHEWRVFEELQVPDDKVMIPGVIDTKTQVVERPELVAERIGRYVELLGAERVMPGSDCGFETGIGNTLGVHPKVAWMKLRSLAEGAELASA